MLLQGVEGGAGALHHRSGLKWACGSAPSTFPSPITPTQVPDQPRLWHQRQYFCSKSIIVMHVRYLPLQESMLSSPMSSVHGGARRPRALELEFVRLGLSLKSCAKHVLSGVSGKLRAARLTAIMGPSGAGEPGCTKPSVMHGMEAFPMAGWLGCTVCGPVAEGVRQACAEWRGYQAAGGTADRHHGPSGT